MGNRRRYTSQHASQHARRHARRGNVFGRLIVGIVGLMMIALALMNILLFFFGESAPATVATRRVGGAREGAPAESRYEWSIDYEFVAQDGQSYPGTATRRGSDMSVPFEREVYYFKAAPYLNALAGNVKPNVGQLILVGLGIFLIVVVSKPSEGNT